MEKTNIVIIGAGVVGLAVASELIKTYDNVIVLEKNGSFGQETSSRNSEVIHAGIYYPRGSLKAELCVAGRKLLYAYCAENNVPHQKIGKFIVATDEREIGDLKKLLARGQENGVDDLCWMSGDELHARELHVKAVAALYSPGTGIIDSHGLMKSLAYRFEDMGGMIAYGNEVKGIEPVKDGYVVTTIDSVGEQTEVASRVVVNAGGLWADKIAAMAGLNNPEYQIKFCKGDYFRVHASKAGMIGHLIYPVPTENHVGLGTHATLDLAGGMRLGPDTTYVDQLEYTVDPAKQKKFHDSVRSFLPFIEFDDLSPDTSGMRPKLQGPGEPVKDFIIRHEKDNGLPGFIDLIGIESPGLTACLAIARRVVGLVAETAINSKRNEVL